MVHAVSNPHLPQPSPRQRAWDHVTPRLGDVVICTSMKAGTTWMQRIMSLLVFGAGPLPAPLVTLSPWIDAAFQGDVEGVVATIEAQEHQRFLKSHLPFDVLLYDPDGSVRVRRP